MPMQIQTKSGSLVIDYYPTKSWDNVKQHDKVLRILTLLGKTISKKVISTSQYVNEVYDRIHNFEYIDNNEDHSNLYQFITLKEGEIK
tara:strand:+ start:1245 stop:1508 length:264 start_codon:yes stop_codon:yes gene_type:complete